MTNRQWRVVFGAVAFGCTAAVAQPDIQAIPFAVTILVIVAAVAGYMKAPPDIDDLAG